ncbi:MAG TPA: serine/threonine-protein kinase [Labilithrix sp.]|nr:serine/threonine-protein kinase [Labilithrix sp.]
MNDPSAPPASPVSPGEIVAGKYRVERLLGVGGMGVVVSARHTALDQVVAIKFLVVNRYATHEESIARFLAEARAAASIESDYVCRVFDVGTLESGVPFMVMEYLEGRDLDDEILHRGPVDLVEAVDYVLQAADALAAAHQLGIVHRDIKPANLFLATRPDGTRRVKVLDFGISKSSGAGAERTSRLRERSSLGTPAYMSPEQVRDAFDIDARTDIWGLGAILYELVTGHMAFVGKDVKEILAHVLEEDPCPMAALRRDVPTELEAIVMRCLDRDRNGRWGSAARFAQALAPFGSLGIFAQLASVQRALGSMASVRVSATHSVQPMVANVRPSYATVPDPAEVLARESIVDEWTKLRARKRTARTAVLGLAAATFLVAAAAVILRMASGSEGTGKGSASAPFAAEGLPDGSTPSATDGSVQSAPRSGATGNVP